MRQRGDSFPPRGDSFPPEGIGRRAYLQSADGQGRGRRRKTSRATLFAMRAPVAASALAPRSASPTGSPEWLSAGSPECVARSRLGAALDAFPLGAGFAAFAPLRSAREAALAELVAERFALRCPGRERGRFSSTPSSSVMSGSLERRAPGEPW